MAKKKEKKVKEVKEVKVKGSKYCPLRRGDSCLVGTVCSVFANDFPPDCFLPVKVNACIRKD